MNSAQISFYLFEICVAQIFGSNVKWHDFKKNGLYSYCSSIQTDSIRTIWNIHSESESNYQIDVSITNRWSIRTSSQFLWSFSLLLCFLLSLWKGSSLWIHSNILSTAIWLFAIKLRCITIWIYARLLSN